jgi:hypothetical protein
MIFDTKGIYALDGSAKDAGDKDYFTITSVEATENNLQKIQRHIDNSRIIFLSSPGLDYEIIFFQPYQCMRFPT